ncbi:MAG: hypothetical protein RMM98_03040 [Acidobacteriota bacterium]|nr:hypothetical protein [Blastocatellia bacterium]MDW8238568.1 hypothetical protein [Acidobacteriota bacterium]
MREVEALKPTFERVQRQALIVGGVALALSVIGLFFDTPQFFRSYLVAYLYWISLPLGSFALLMLHHLVGGGWGFAIRRMMEAATRTFLPMALLFLPIVLGLAHLYEWTHADVVAKDEVLRHKSSYLNVPFFLARAAIYFIVWIGWSYLLNKWSFEQDRTHDPSLTRRIQDMSGPGLLLFGATVTFASVDWVMSLEPHWYSTIYGIIFMIGQGLTTLAFMILLLSRLWRRPPLVGVVEVQQFHDLGNLLLTFVMLWAYVAFSQFLIIWSANLPEEIPWYLRRTQGGWKAVAGALILFHFVVPFFLLLLRVTKRVAPRIALLSLAMLFMRWVDLFWMVTPAFSHGEAVGLHVHWLDVTTFVGLGGLWLGLFFWQLKERPLLPLYDPRLEESLHGAKVLHHG